MSDYPVLCDIARRLPGIDSQINRAGYAVLYFLNN